jgi:ABC-type lipoprotein export system ATPase subunit
VNDRPGGGAVLSGEGLVRRFGDVRVLQGASIALHPGELVVLLGASGSGKTTLLNLLCGWEVPDAGTLRWKGQVADLNRRSWLEVAVVPQALGLLEELTVAENVLLPQRFNPSFPTRASWPEALDLTELVRRRPGQLSLGERQRVALARAVAFSPELLLGDEPTSHQDSTRTGLVLSELRSLTSSGTCCLLASHDRALLSAADRVLMMEAGRIAEG